MCCVTEDETAEKIESTAESTPQVLAKCGKESIGACGSRAPGVVDGDSGLSHQVVIKKVSINAVTIWVSRLLKGRRVQAVIDSGPEVSVWSSKDYNSLPDSDKLPLLRPTIELVVADHERKLAAEGVAMTRIQIHDLEFQWPMYVASIPESLLLVSDILDVQDLVVSSRKGLMVGNTWVACEVNSAQLEFSRWWLWTQSHLLSPTWAWDGSSSAAGTWSNTRGARTPSWSR